MDMRDLMNEASAYLNENTFKDIDNNRYWLDTSKEIEKEFKRLKLGKPTITKSFYQGKANWTIISKKPVLFQDGHVGKLRIILGNDQLSELPDWSINDPDLSGKSYGDNKFDLKQIKPVSKEVIKKQKAFDAVKKLFPKSKINGNTITIVE